MINDATAAAFGDDDDGDDDGNGQQEAERVVKKVANRRLTEKSITCMLFRKYYDCLLSSTNTFSANFR